MNGMQILVAAMSRRDARRINRELNKASVKSAGATAHTQRRIERIGWEGKRSPSRLGRMGERAQQLDDVVNPLSRTVVTIAQMVVAVMDAVEHYERFRGRNDATGNEAAVKSGSEEAHTTATKDDGIVGLESAPS